MATLVSRTLGTHNVHLRGLGSGGGDEVEVTSEDITDSTTVGRAVLTATDAAAARTAIGAGTSNLALGTTSSTALAGDYVPAWNTLTGVPASLTAAQAAGTASIRAIGTTATTAAAGNHVHTATQVTATAVPGGTATTVQGILLELEGRIAALEPAP